MLSINLCPDGWSIQGILTKSTATQLYQHLIEAQLAGPTTRLDLEHVSQVDSCGFAVLVWWHQYCLAKQVTLELMHAPLAARQLAQVSRVEQELNWCSSMAEEESHGIS